jgi:DNA-binding CsgD family transcriptional regulator
MDAEARAELVRSFRMPESALPTLLLALAFYGLFGVALARPGSGTAAYLLATYGVFAAMGPALFGFGAGVGYERERAVLRHAEQGLSNREIAEALALSPGTVRNYRSEAAQKLGADNRVEAARIARSNGWL